MSRTYSATVSHSARSHRASSAIPDLDGWVEKLGRFGYAAKGTVYLIIGYLAARAAFVGGSVEGSEGVLTMVRQQSFGTALLWILALGLSCYAAWRLVQAILDPEGARAPGSERRWFQRGYYLVSGLLHAGLVVSAASLLGVVGDSGGSGPTLEGWPVYLAAAVIFGLGLRQLYRAYAVDFGDRLALHELSAKARKWFIRSTRWALTARGVVFGTIALLVFVQANRSLSADSAPGLEEAMQTLGAQPFGAWIFAFIALGLGLYGLYQWVKAYYRVFDV